MAEAVGEDVRITAAVGEGTARWPPCTGVRTALARGRPRASGQDQRRGRRCREVVRAAVAQPEGKTALYDAYARRSDRSEAALQARGVSEAEPALQVVDTERARLGLATARRA
jgi:hypothetical protein